MEYWSVVKENRNLLIITPSLQCSNTPKMHEIESSPMGQPHLRL